MQSEPFNFLGGNGNALAGELDLPGGPAKAFAVFAHCFTCTKRSIAAVRISRALTALGIGVLRFDFTGLGEADEHPAIDAFSGNVADMIAAGQAMATAGRTPQLLIGHSLGGAAALAAALELPDVVAVATIGAPFDVEHIRGLLGEQLHAVKEDGGAEVDLGGRRFKLSGHFLTDLGRHDQGARIERLGRALLVLHSPHDEVVGIDNAAAIFVAARHSKSFVSLDGADHLLTDPSDAEYAAKLIAHWASRYLRRPPHPPSELQRGNRLRAS